jgi:hypothetical protein
MSCTKSDVNPLFTQTGLAVHAHQGRTLGARHNCVRFSASAIEGLLLTQSRHSRGLLGGAELPYPLFADRSAVNDALDRFICRSLIDRLLAGTISPNFGASGSLSCPVTKSNGTPLGSRSSATGSPPRIRSKLAPASSARVCIHEGRACDLCTEGGGFGPDHLRRIAFAGLTPASVASESAGSQSTFILGEFECLSRTHS